MFRQSFFSIHRFFLRASIDYREIDQELRTPLMLIRGPAQDALAEPLIVGKTDPATAASNRARWRLVERASGRLLRLVNSLLLFSSAEAGRLHVRAITSLRS